MGASLAYARIQQLEMKANDNDIKNSREVEKRKEHLSSSV